MKKTKTHRSGSYVVTSAATFDDDVLARSQTVPVVVDFWAPWCGPCRALTPALERLAEQYAGRFVLVKANTDELPEVAAQFNVQGIPAVFAVSEGKVIDFFSGALPEAHVRDWLTGVLLAVGLEAARKLEATEPARAEEQYRVLLADAPRSAEAKIGVARVLLAQQRVDECRQVMAELEQRGFLEPEAEKVKAALQLGQKTGDDLAERRAAAEASPDDLPLQLALAESLVGAQQFEKALAICLSLVQRDRPGVGERARQLMIDIFRVLPDDSELTAEFRRKLSMALF